MEAQLIHIVILGEDLDVLVLIRESVGAQGLPVEHQHIVENQHVEHVHGIQVLRDVQKHVVDIKLVQVDHVVDGHVDLNGHLGEHQVQDAVHNQESYINNKRNRFLFLF